jgi:predicted component of viral defense system (DUF524 family)
LNSIIDNPDKKLIKEEILKEIQDIETPACHLFTELISESSAISRTNSDIYHFKVGNNKYRFVKAYEEISRITYNTYPNQFIKYFLKYLKQDLNIIEEALRLFLNDKCSESYKIIIEKLFIPSINEIKGKNVNRILKREFFNDVSELKYFSTTSQTLLKDFRYQKIFSSFLELIKGLSVSDTLEDLLKDPISNMPELYEYWCFVRLWKYLESKDILGIKGTPIELDKIFEKGEIYDVLKHGCTIKFGNETTLSFNKYYGKGDKYFSYSVGVRPDFTLEIGNKLIIFDAKYRIEWIEDVTNLKNTKEKEDKEEREKLDKILDEERRSTFKLGDLYKMHTYREAIRRNNDNPVWVIALYPGDTSILFLESGKRITCGIKDFLYTVINFSPNNKCFNYLGGVVAIPMRPEGISH